MSRQSRKMPALTLILALIPAAVLWSGCGTYSSLKKSTETLVRDFRAPDDDLKKKVFRAGLINQVAEARQDIGALVDSTYLEALPQRCPALFLTGTDSSEAGQALNRLLQKIDNLSLIRIGKERGVTAVVSSRFSAIAVRMKDTGFLWLRKKQPFAWINAATEVYDTETGAKYLDQTFTREIKLTDESAESIRSGSISSVPAVEKAVLEIIKEMADAVCNALVRKAWKGYVVRVSGDALTLSSGSQSGLAPGRVLTVYEPGPKIQGTEGQIFLQPGKKIGEIRVTEVFDDSAEAVVTSGEGFQPENVVKTK